MRDCEVLEKIMYQCGRPTQCFYCKMWVTIKETDGNTPFHRDEKKSFCYFEIKPEYWNDETIKTLLEKEDVSERVCEERKKQFQVLSGKNVETGEPLEKEDTLSKVLNVLFSGNNMATPNP